MLTLNTTNLHKVAAAHGLSKKELASTKKQLKPFLKQVHARGQGFYTVIDDMSVVKEIEDFAKKVKGTYTDIVVLGIGGSALGTICLQQSLRHLFENELVKRNTPKLHVLDNIDPALMLEVQDIINLKKTLFIVVSKSGGTPEILSQYMYFRKIVNTKKLIAKKHFVFITDTEKGLLREIANDEHIPAFAVPENVGGRFSVQTAVGLLPAALIGINIRKLLKGMQQMRDQFASENMSENLPFQLASMQYLLNQKGKVMNVIMPYSQRLIRLADWYRQLLAESIGKAKNDAGETVNVGITPINALGATDQHSQSQLYNEGPNDKFFMFIEVENLGKNVAIPNLLPKHNEVAFLKGISFNKLMATEKRAMADSYTKSDRPNITIHVPEVNEQSLGELFMLFEGATAFLGEFYGINAFDQPGVELSKQLTKKYLLEKK